jgi:TonB-linked SusC/RagA family outer membrane protein
MRDAMPMKISRVGIRAILAAGFLYMGLYGQDAIPTDLTPAQLDSLTAALQSAAIRHDTVNEQKQEATKTTPVKDTAAKQSEVKEAVVTPKPQDTVKAQVQEATITAPVKDTAAKQSEVKETEVAPMYQDTAKAQTQELTKTAPVTDTVAKKSDAGATPAAPTAPAPVPAVAKTATDRDTVSSSEANGEKVLELDKDVVVGYGTMKKEDLTGSVVSVKADDLAKDAVFSVRKALQGRAAGVTVTQNSGAPGKALTVRIRGVGTINNSDPLYIVDGMPSSNIDYLNPNDIESISILKDASATAIYGSRGANGVVMVTTKKAKEGVSKVTYDMYIGTQAPWKKPSLCNAEQWAMLNNEAQRAANEPVNSGIEDPSGLGEGTDWWDLVTNNNALIHQENVSVMRGTDKLRYFLSAGYFNQEGIVKGSELHKLTLRFNTENKLSPWFSLGNSLGVARFNTNWANESDEWNSLLVNTLAMDPVTKPRNDSGNLVPSEFSNVKNPVGIIQNTNITTQKTALAGTLYSTLNLFNVLKLNSTLGIDMAFNDSTGFLPKYIISSSDQNSLAIVTRKTGTDNTLNFENTVTYERTIADDHNVKLLAGAAAQDREFDSVLAEGYDTPSNDSTQRELDAAKSEIKRVAGKANGNRLASAFGRMEYNYAGKYLLTATFRRDGSSRFAPNHHWGDFPSVAGAWKITEEPFMESVSFIEGLKLRAGWGKTGNQEIPDYLYLTTTNGNKNYPFGVKQTINPGTSYSTLGNPEIQWESQAATNAGLDITAFGGRIEFLSDFYIKKTDSMLIQPPIPLITGLETPPMVNLGAIENKGMELVLNYKESIGSFLSNTGINFSMYRNKVLSLGGDTAGIRDADYMNAGYVTKTQVGHPIASFYGRKTKGIFQNWDEIRSFTYEDEDGKTQLIQPNAVPGDIRYRDDNHDGVPDEGYLGSPHPKFTMGLNGNMSYKGFDLDWAFQAVYGNKIFNGTRLYTENGAGLYNLDTRMLDRWTGEGSTSDENLPRMTVSDKNPNGKIISDRYIEDGSYARFKTLQLGYTLTESLSRKFRIRQCRVYLGAENLFTLTRYTGLEPEVGLGEARGSTRNTSLTLGVDRTTYPQARTYMVGLNVTL